jgi:hypothetical protein
MSDLKLLSTITDGMAKIAKAKANRKEIQQDYSKETKVEE